jgi:threonine dehydrogenase-like Zn-dependent dehydrogenase
MKGIVFAGHSKIEYLDFPDPTPGHDEVVLEIKASGMCGSDLKFYRAPRGEGLKALGYNDAPPVVAGHEPCGVVVAVGASVNPKRAYVGQRAMVHHYRGCGACPHCSTGWMQLCDEGVKEIYGLTGHGAHAKYMKCPASTIVELPEELTFETGAAIACGTGTAWGALSRLDLKGDQTIAIFGQGPVGLSSTQLTHGLGAHASIDASSSASARKQAVQCVRTWGKACYVGEGGSVSIDVSPDMLRRQVTIIGSWTFSTVGQGDCARFVADRGVDVDALFTHRWGFEDAVQAYQLFDKQTSGKGVFLF